METKGNRQGSFKVLKRRRVPGRPPLAFSPARAGAADGNPGAARGQFAQPSPGHESGKAGYEWQVSGGGRSRARVLRRPPPRRDSAQAGDPPTRNAAGPAPSPRDARAWEGQEGPREKPGARPPAGLPLRPQGRIPPPPTPRPGGPPGPNVPRPRHAGPGPQLSARGPAALRGPAAAARPAPQGAYFLRAASRPRRARLGPAAPRLLLGLSRGLARPPGSRARRAAAAPPPRGWEEETRRPGAASRQETTPAAPPPRRGRSSPQAAAAALSLRKRIPPGPRQPRRRRGGGGGGGGGGRKTAAWTKEWGGSGAWGRVVEGGARTRPGLRRASVSFPAKGALG